MDHYAAIVGRHLVGMGLKIGRDISCSPALTMNPSPNFCRCLSRPSASPRILAHVCYERLIAQMANPSVPLPGMTLIDVELVIRDSSGF